MIAEVMYVVGTIKMESCSNYNSATKSVVESSFKCLALFQCDYAGTDGI